MWDPYVDFKSAIMPNGLTVHAAHWPDRPWESVGFVVHVGMENDPVELEDLSHFVEHLISENAGILSDEISTFFEDCGGKVNLGKTGYYDTNYRFFAPLDRTIFKNALSIFGKMLLTAKLDRSIEKERKIIIAEFNKYYSDKTQVGLMARERKALYAGHWMERFIGPFGHPTSVKRITQRDLQLFYDAYYTPSNISIVGVGGMQIEELVDALSNSPFSINKKGIRTPLPEPMIEIAPPSENRYVFEISKHLKTESPTEVGAFRSVAKVSGSINNSTITIMDGLFSEIISDEVREKRFWAHSFAGFLYGFRSFYEFSIDCDGLEIEALDEIEEVIESCITSVKNREDLFNRVKRRMLAGNYMADLSANRLCKDVINEVAAFHRPIPRSEYARNIENTTMDDVCNVLPFLSADKRWTLIKRP